MSKSGKIALIGMITFIPIYYFFDPALSNLFPKCPFLTLTGYQCPGCGSQRAIHQLLQGNIVGAFQYNPLLVVALPYLILGALFEFTSLKSKYAKAQRILFGYKTIYIILAIIILFWISRNLF